MYKRYFQISGISRKEISTLELDCCNRSISLEEIKKLNLNWGIMEINIKDYILCNNKKNVGIINKELRENKLKD